MQNAGKQLLDHASKASVETPQPSASAEINSVNAFMYGPTHSSVNTITDVDKHGPIETRIQKHNEFPQHHPPEFKPKGKSTRFYYKYTNVPELKRFFVYYITTYRLHVLNKHADVKTYPALSDYLRLYPLGVTRPEFSDTLYYKNANKMTEALAYNATAPGGSSPKPVPSPVLTDLANAHVVLQQELYLYIRANTHRFMDESCQTILDTLISKHEQDNNLEGDERLALGTRYSWSQMQSDLQGLCCISTPGDTTSSLYTPPSVLTIPPLKNG